jgi:hypothetical protein
MLSASLVELAIPKRPMRQKHNIQLANFDMTSLPVVWFRKARAFELPDRDMTQRISEERQLHAGCHPCPGRRDI